MDTRKVVINEVDGLQKILVLGLGGSYNIPERLVFDEAVDGLLPSNLETNVGGLVRQIDGKVVVDPVLLAQAQAQKQTKDQVKAKEESDKAVRLANFKKIATLNTLPELKAILKDIIDHLGLG